MTNGSPEVKKDWPVCCSSVGGVEDEAVVDGAMLVRWMMRRSGRGVTKRMVTGFTGKGAIHIHDYDSVDRSQK